MIALSRNGVRRFLPLMLDFAVAVIPAQESGLRDYIGMFAVACMGCDALAEEFEKKHDDYSKIMVQVTPCWFRGLSRSRGDGGRRIPGAGGRSSVQVIS